MGLRRPPPLRPGARVHVIAPSGPVPAQRFDRGLKALRRRIDLDIVLPANLHEQDGYFAGNDAMRIVALHAAFSDPEATTILCARGGYGATRLLGSLDPQLLVRHPKVLVGFSDVTALLAWVHTRCNLPSIHGPVVTQLADLADEDIDRLVDMLRGELPQAVSAEEGTVAHGGRVEGPVIAANLEVLRSLIGTRYFPPLKGCILALEEVHERPYRIDRALTHLLSSGALRGVRGIAIGQLVECEEPEQGHLFGPSALDVVLERLGTLGIPVATGFPFGHDTLRNAAIPFGTHALLDADNCTLYFTESPIEIT